MQQAYPAYRNAQFEKTSARGSARNPATDQQSLPGTRWQPEPGPLLVVSPHPRDEIIGAGGLIHTWVSWGHEVTVLSVTDGLGERITAEHLNRSRRDELRAALRKLCARHVSVVRMGMRNGHVCEAQNRLRHAIDALLEPHMTLVAPFEQGAHPDDEAVGKVCREAAQANQIKLACYGTRSSDSCFANSDALKWGRFSLDVEARRAKAYALQCFHSLRTTTGNSVLSPFEAFLI